MATTYEQIRGVRSTEDILQTIRPLYWNEKVFQVYPDKSPLLRLITKLSRKNITDPEFNWFSDSLLNSWDTVTNNAGTGATLTVTHKEYFSIGDVIKVPSTGECILVTAASGSGAGNLTVTRGIGTTTATAIDGSSTPVPIMNLGNSSEEFSGMPEIKTTKKVKSYNYTEIIKTPFGVSGTLNKTKLRTGNELDYQRAKMAVEHSFRIEKKFWFGERGEDTSGSEIRRFTGGVLSFIPVLRTVASYTALTEDEWDEFMRDLFAHGSDKKVVFCSSKIISLVNGFVKGKLQTYIKDKTYGVSIYKYVSPHGEIGLISHKEILAGKTYGGYAVGLDLDKLSYRYLDGRDTALYKNVQDPDEDGQIDMYLTEAGLEIGNESDCHGALVVSDTGTYY